MSEVAAGTPLVADQTLVGQVRFDAGGLVPAVVQDAASGTVLTVAYMNEEALRRTLASGRTWFWSRSRQEYWQKGETSGDRQYVRRVLIDCDGDALVVQVDQHGKGACHTGEWTCFYRTIGEGPGLPVADGPAIGQRAGAPDGSGATGGSGAAGGSGGAGGPA